MVWVDSYLPEPNSRGFRARNASRLIRENSCGIEVSLKSRFEQLQSPLVAGWRDLGETGGGITLHRLNAGGGITLQQVAA